MLKEEKNLGLVIQENLSQEKHINRIFGDTFRMLIKYTDGFSLPR